MTLAPEHPRTHFESTSDAVKAYARFFSAAVAVHDVERMVLSEGAGSLDLCVFLWEEAPEEAEDRVILLERAFRRMVGAFPFRIHVIPLAEMAAGIFPESETVFERER